MLVVLQTSQLDFSSILESSISLIYRFSVDLLLSDVHEFVVIFTVVPARHSVADLELRNLHLGPA